MAGALTAPQSVSVERIARFMAMQIPTLRVSLEGGPIHSVDLGPARTLSTEPLD